MTGRRKVRGESWEPWNLPLSTSRGVSSQFIERKVCSCLGEKGTEAPLPCCPKKKGFLLPRQLFQHGLCLGASQPTPRGLGRSCAPTSGAAPQLHPAPAAAPGLELQRGTAAAKGFAPRRCRRGVPSTWRKNKQKKKVRPASSN